MGLSPYLHLTHLNQPITTMSTDWALYDKRLFWQEEVKYLLSGRLSMNLQCVRMLYSMVECWGEARGTQPLANPGDPWRPLYKLRYSTGIRPAHPVHLQ